VRVVGVGLAAAAGGQQPDPGGQCRRHVEHVRTGRGELLGDPAAETVGAFDSELALRPSGEDGAQGAGVDRKSAGTELAAGGVEGDGGERGTSKRPRMSLRRTGAMPICWLITDAGRFCIR
jgi:hypothetical protein